MAHWHTETILSDIAKIPGIKSVISQGQGGDVDTDNLVITIKGTSDNLFVCGFDDVNDITDSSDIDVPMVEVTDGLSSNGGLNSNGKKTATAYINVRQYFIDKGFVVVPRLKAYF